MWSQFFMRLELESTCSSWIGIRKLLSERQKTEILYKAEGEGKVKAWTSLVSWMRWHLWATFGSVLSFQSVLAKNQCRKQGKYTFFYHYSMNRTQRQEPGYHLITNRGQPFSSQAFPVFARVTSRKFTFTQAK